MTARPLYPNLFVFVIAHPGVGKSRTIAEGRNLYAKLPEHHLAPISLTFASLVDFLVKSKRTLIRMPDDPLEYHSAFVCAHELGAFIHKYDNEMVDGLSTFYDIEPYAQNRRTSDIKIKMAYPQVNLLGGSTPQNLTAFMPEKAWGQGFTSRMIMVFSDERIVGDDFAPGVEIKTGELEHDLNIINGLCGQFHVTPEYRTAVNNWKELGCDPVPSHPKLIHYATRRVTHLYKLSMVASVDRDNGLALTVADFNRAMGWLLEAEREMPEVFKAGTTNADGQAMDEIAHYVMINDRGTGVSEQRIVHFARERVPIHSILRIIEIMERSGQIACVNVDKRTAVRYFRSLKAKVSSEIHPGPVARQ
jgi:hypothetical protein